MRAKVIAVAIAAALITAVASAGAKSRQIMSAIQPTMAASRINVACDATTDATILATETANLRCAHIGPLHTAMWDVVTVEAYLVWRAASHVKMQCDESSTGAAPWKLIQERNASTGYYAGMTWDKTVGFTGGWPVTVDVNYINMRCRFWGGSDGATDLLSATAVFGAN